MSAITLEKRAQQAWITLNRPGQKNILNGEAFLGLADAWQEVRDDADIRVAVLTASGETDSDRAGSTRCCAAVSRD